MNANSPKIRLKNFPKSTVSFTDSFCTFKLISAEIKSETIVLNGILSLPNDNVEIELNGKFNKIKNKYHLIFDDVEIPLESENKQAVLSAEFVFKK